MAQVESAMGSGNQLIEGKYHTVSELHGHCISVINPTEEKVILSFGSKGSSIKQFSYPTGVAVDDKDNILVVDTSSRCIKKFT